MSEMIRYFIGSGYNKNVTLIEYRYADGTRNHWLFRDRQGRPYNPESQEEAEKIVRDWHLKEITEEVEPLSEWI